MGFQLLSRTVIKVRIGLSGEVFPSSQMYSRHTKGGLPKEGPIKEERPVGHCIRWILLDLLITSFSWCCCKFSQIINIPKVHWKIP